MFFNDWYYVIADNDHPSHEKEEGSGVTKPVLAIFRQSIQLVLDELRDVLTTEARHNPQALIYINRYLELPRQEIVLVWGMSPDINVYTDEEKPTSTRSPRIRFPKAI